MWEYLELFGFIGSTLFIRIQFEFILLYEIVWKLNRGVPLNLISSSNICVGFNLN